MSTPKVPTKTADLSFRNHFPFLKFVLLAFCTALILANPSGESRLSSLEQKQLQENPASIRTTSPSSPLPTELLQPQPVLLDVLRRIQISWPWPREQA